jgi:hypothetical protein
MSPYTAGDNADSPCPISPILILVTTPRMRQPMLPIHHSGASLCSNIGFSLALHEKRGADYFNICYGWLGDERAHRVEVRKSFGRRLSVKKSGSPT